MYMYTSHVKEHVWHTYNLSMVAYEYIYMLSLYICIYIYTYIWIAFKVNVDCFLQKNCLQLAASFKIASEMREMFIDKQPQQQQQQETTAATAKATKPLKLLKCPLNIQKSNKKYFFIHKNAPYQCNMYVCVCMCLYLCISACGPLEGGVYSKYNNNHSAAAAASAAITLWRHIIAAGANVRLSPARSTCQRLLSLLPSLSCTHAILGSFLLYIQTFIHIYTYIDSGQTDKWHLSTFYALLNKLKYVCALLHANTAFVSVSTARVSTYICMYL